MVSANRAAAGGCSIDEPDRGRYTVVSVNPRRLLLGMLLALGVAAALAPLSAAAVDVSPLSCAGPNACDIVSVYTSVFWIAMAVLVIVGGLLIYAALRFRRKDDREHHPAQRMARDGLGGGDRQHLCQRQEGCRSSQGDV